jgi:hypothetical protein
LLSIQSVAMKYRKANRVPYRFTNCVNSLVFGRRIVSSSEILLLTRAWLAIPVPTRSGS